MSFLSRVKTGLRRFACLHADGRQKDLTCAQLHIYTPREEEMANVAFLNLFFFFTMMSIRLRYFKCY